MDRIKLLSFIIFSGIVLAYFFNFSLQPTTTNSAKVLPFETNIQTPTPTPTPTVKVYQPIDIYTPPLLPEKPAYTLIIVGDSMTESLGQNFEYLRLDLKKHYPDKIFGIFNYGFGSTSILSAENRLDNDSIYQGRTYPAILTRQFDIIIIESFGNNPLSEFPIEKGLEIQTTTLDHLVAKIADTHPNSIIVFMATVAPSQALFGKGVVDLTPLVRTQWANERRAYIENHISYAKRHHFPLINVYEKSMDKNGLAISSYLETSNYIHPSSAGVRLISKTIADYLFLEGLLPNQSQVR